MVEGAGHSPSCLHVSENISATVCRTYPPNNVGDSWLCRRRLAGQMTPTETTTPDHADVGEFVRGSRLFRYKYKRQIGDENRTTENVSVPSR